MTSRVERELIAEAAASSEKEENDALSRLQRQLAQPSGSVPIQGYLLKRSENLRLWNQRWFSLDPSTARMEYRIQRTDVHARGTIMFGPDSTITVSPINFHGAKQYDGCCLYIGTAGQKEYFLCAETPGAARAWVATLRAAVRVLKAHREAVQSLSGGKPVVAGAVAAATQAAINAAKDAQEEVAAANRKSVLSLASPRLLSTLASAAAAAPGPPAATPGGAGDTGTAAAAAAEQSPASAPQSAQQHEGDTVTSLKEMLLARDSEIRQLLAELHSHDSVVAELAEQGTAAARAADAAAEAAAAVARERDQLKEMVSKLCAELEGKLEGSDVAAKERDRAAAAEARVVALQGECERLRVALSAEEAARTAAEAEAEKWRKEAERSLSPVAPEAVPRPRALVTEPSPEKPLGPPPPAAPALDGAEVSSPASSEQQPPFKSASAESLSAESGLFLSVTSEDLPKPPEEPADGSAAVEASGTDPPAE